MNLFKPFKKLICCILLAVFIPTQAWAQGITIAPGTSLRLNTDDKLIVPGSISNMGTLSATNGDISLTGNWLNSGTFVPGTAKIIFNGGAGVTQTLNSGGSGVNNAFYNLSHEGAGTLQLIANDVTIANNFINDLGPFDGGNGKLTINVGGNWSNTSTFVPNDSTVNFNGNDQTVLGTNSFYNFTKSLIANGPYNLTFEAGRTQSISNLLTLQGNSSHFLVIRSTVSGSQAKLNLDTTNGSQAINYVDVHDSDASLGKQLIGRNASNTSNLQNNLNWQFFNTAVSWNGSVSSDWNNPLNWNPQEVPVPGDSVVINSGTPFTPALTSNVNVGDLTIGPGAKLTLQGHDLTVAQFANGSGAFSNNGTLIMQGNEKLYLTMDSTHGTFEYDGDGNGNSDPRTLSICSPIAPNTCSNNISFNNLTINDANPTVLNRDTFLTDGNIVVNGDLNVSSSSLNVSSSNSSLVVNGSVSIAATGIFTAPLISKQFSVAGNFANLGTFNNSSGLLNLNGGDQTLSGTSSFYQLTKIVTTAHTLTFGSGLQTITNHLDLEGASNQLLTVTSTDATQETIALMPGATQNLNFLTAQNSNAGTFPAQIKLVPNNSNSIGNNQNWVFSTVELTWKGGSASNPNDWGSIAGVPSTNWDLGFVPRAGDDVVIPDVSVASNQPKLTAAVTVRNLTLNKSVSGSTINIATLDLNGFGLTVTNTFTNKGNVVLKGSERPLSLTQDVNPADAGTFTYVGDGTGVPIAVYDFGSNNYYNLVINDAHTGASSPDLADIFTTSHGLHIAGNLTVTRGTLDMSGGTSQIDGSVTIAAAGTLKAPGSTSDTAFLVAGDWNNLGSFNSNNGKIVLNGLNQIVSGSSTFYQFVKNVTSTATLTFDPSGTQIFNNNLTLQGLDATHRLQIRSKVDNTQAHIMLTKGSSLLPVTQVIKNVDVKDSNANGGVLLIARGSSQDSNNNINWHIGTGNFIWMGSLSSEWNNPANWDLGLVPADGDTVTINSAPSNQPDFCPPAHTYVCAGVSIGNLTINDGASLTLSGQNLTVATNFTNKGTVNLQGSEVLTLTMDSTEGTFSYNGAGAGSSTPHTLSINNSPNLIFNNLTINDPHTPKDIFTTAGSVQVKGNLNINSGTFDASSTTTSLVVTGSVAIEASGIFNGPPKSPTPSPTFTVAGNWSNAGVYNPSTGAVTFIGPNIVTITGSTNFYDFDTKIPGKTFKFDTALNTKQTITHKMNVSSDLINLINFISLNPGTQWHIDFPNGPQSVGELNVVDSFASTNVITCNNCNPGYASPINQTANDNDKWDFEVLKILTPAPGTTVGQSPTIIGQAKHGTVVYIRDISNNIIATTNPDSKNNFRVVVGYDDAQTRVFTITPNRPQLTEGANSLTIYNDPVLTTAPGNVVNLTVTATPATAQVPKILQLNGIDVTEGFIQFINGTTPVIQGQGAPGQAVTAQALDGDGNLIQTTTLGTVGTDGNFSVNFPSTSALPSSTNYLSVVVGNSTNQTASALIQIALTDPFGYVYNTSTNELLKDAVITIYDASTKQIANDPGLKSCTAPVPAVGSKPAILAKCCDMSGVCIDSAGVQTTNNPPGNPFTTLENGFYSFFLTKGKSYYVKIALPGFTYPSVKPNKAGRQINVGSKGEVFNIGSSVSQIDQPMDANNMLLRITKKANKSEATVGDIVTYTVNIENLSATDPVNFVLLNDQIPPGFKYISNRVLLKGSPIADPIGQRPLLFNIGPVAPNANIPLQYQLVVGSGVTMGSYKNVAVAQFADGTDISNQAESAVRIIPDPVFDLGSVIGKVFFDWNENGIQDPPYYDAVSHVTTVEKPVPNVQIVMEDGTIITTDRDGKFNVPGLLPGRHILRVDERTLPPGSYLTTEKATVVDITQGSIVKANFGVNIDETKITGRDAVFFNEKIHLTQDNKRPVPRLNAALFNVSADAAANTEEVLLYNGILVHQAEFRIFTNYSPFITNWHLDIIDADTKKLIRHFEGTPLNINDPIYWNGRDDHEQMINVDHKYAYVISVSDNKFNRDDTKEKPITLRQILDEKSLKKEHDVSKEILKERAKRYRTWLSAGEAVNNINHQLIPIQGETIHLDRQGTDVKSIRILRGNNLFLDLPLSQQYGLTPDELLASGPSVANEKDNLEVILPNGDYKIDVVSAKTSGATPVQVQDNDLETAPASGIPTSNLVQSKGTFERYSRPLKVGDDYLMFVALGDAKVGYNIDRGHIEPIQDKTLEPGFYKQGKAAFYLKGQILGKYLVTSSFDSDRAQKALFRKLDPNTYYPVYGDQSSINYDATDTQGPLYLLVQWDKSSAILGNYAVDFNDTEFAAFSRSYYGGKIDYQSVANNPYGDARTKIVVFHAEVQQLPGHNEFLATGGSLYFLKHRAIVQGSDKVTIQVRDQNTGLVIASKEMANGADYELDNDQGRILFWQPVAMIAKSESIISNGLIDGNPIYVVIDYQYAVQDKLKESSQGTRVTEGIGDNLVVGSTYIQEKQSGTDYTLQGADATLHLDKDATIKTEFAQTKSQSTGSYISTDGGITFTQMAVSNLATGKAYGIKGDARLFDRIGLQSYYKWVDNSFATPNTTSQQGKEMTGLALTFDMNPETRLTAKEDIQKLIQGGNLQTSAQVGATQTSTTMVQIVHQSERLKLTGQYQLTQVRNLVTGVVSSTNQSGAVIGGRADYDLTDRIKLSLGQQVDVTNKLNNATTLGIQNHITDHLTLRGQETFSGQGRAADFGVTNQITPKTAITTDYTLTNYNSGQVDKTAAVGVENKVNDNLMATGSVALTASSTGASTTTASVGTKAKLSDTSSLDLGIGKSQSSTGVQSTSVSANGSVQVDQNTTLTATSQLSNGNTIKDALGIGTTSVTTTSIGVQATRKIDEMSSRSASVTLADDTLGSKTTTVGLDNTGRIDQELQAVTSNSFTFSPNNGTTDNSKYGLVRNRNGQQLEGDFTRQTANQQGAVSNSNIYGLTGDVNDKLALSGSIEHGKVQNLDKSRTNRLVFSAGAGYVYKDTETAVERFKNSIKLELRLDKNSVADNTRQYVFYDAMDGKITDNISANIKFDYSKTFDTKTNAVLERHQEIILGSAYRPVNFDKLNLIAEYTYKSGFGPTGQIDQAAADIQKSRAQVFSGEAIYDVNDQWQLAEKIAYKINSELVTGFNFTQTHTWLVIHRVNYKVDRNWTISGEYRDLTQVEAKDNKQGILLEATRSINANTELGIGWNFTQFNDDLTNLSYTAQGPFVRLTGKFYDESPEERARARAKWLDAKISEWAWVLVRRELARHDSKIVLELNRLFMLAKNAQKSGRLEESKEIYRDIIAAGQMMFDEAREYIRGRIGFEEDMQKLDKTAHDYFKGGEYIKARKIWEKVVEQASSGVVK